jgi:hypothetical protein
MQLPVPDTFYYHYKRDASKGVYESAYVIKGVAIDCDNRHNSLVIYKPLYFCDPRHADEKGTSFFARRVEEFWESVTKDGQTLLRFTPITDETIIQQLKAHELYASDFLDV